MSDEPLSDEQMAELRGLIAQAMSQRSGLPWWVLPGLAAAVLTIYGAALWQSADIGDSTLRTQMFTGAYGLATLALGYFFGSSAGSQRKDDTLARAALAPKAEAEGSDRR